MAMSMSSTRIIIAIDIKGGNGEFSNTAGSAPADRDSDDGDGAGVAASSLMTTHDRIRSLDSSCFKLEHLNRSFAIELYASCI